MIKQRLDNILDFVRNGASIKQENGKQGYPITRIETIWNKTIDNSRFGYADIFEDELIKYDKYILEKGDILMTHINSPKHLGKCALYRGHPERLIHGMNLLCLRANYDVSHPEYLRYYFNSKLFKNQLVKIANQSVNQASFSAGNLKKLKIPLPSLDQQKKIAAILDAADDYRLKTKALIKKYDELTQSLFLEMFGDPVTNPKGWDIISVGKALDRRVILKIQDGNHGEKHPKSEDFLNEGTPMIFANNLTGNTLNYVDGHHLSDDVVNKLRIGFSTGGDVLLTHKGSIGLSDVVPDDIDLLILSPQVTYYRVCRDSINPIYLKFFFLSQFFFRRLEKLGKQSTRAYVGITKQRLLPLMTPNPLLQNQFAERVKAIEAQKVQAQDSLSQAENLFNSLLQKAFKGELG